MGNLKNLKGMMEGVTVTIGTQWGDEGKGKIVDLFAEEADVVVRSSGGANAGHTVVNEQGEFKLHLIPSGIFNPDALCIIGNGVVIDPFALTQEMAYLEKKGIHLSASNLLISERSHLILPWHQKRDTLSEVARGGNKIGTTGRGIGPAYSDRRARVGIRVGDLMKVGTAEFEETLMRELVWQERLVRVMSGEQLISDLDTEKFDTLSKKQLLHLAHKAAGRQNEFDFDELNTVLTEAAKRLAPHIGDSVLAVKKAFEEHTNILGEGAQGALLDIDRGTYPYVTSSNTGVEGFLLATNLNIQDISRVVGVTKAYSTRVGSGPMPTKQDDVEASTHLQTQGAEVGTTTGRKRDCGWFDGPATEYGARGATEIALTKLDVLSGLDSVKICTGYKVGNKVFTQITNPEIMERVDERIYQVLPGWKEISPDTDSFKDLPKNAQNYVKRVEEILGKPITLVSVGPHRNETILR